jgi:hypothetical protein
MFVRQQLLFINDSSDQTVLKFSPTQEERGHPPFNRFMVGGVKKRSSAAAASLSGGTGYLLSFDTEPILRRSKLDF